MNSEKQQRCRVSQAERSHGHHGVFISRRAHCILITGHVHPSGIVRHLSVCQLLSRCTRWATGLHCTGRVSDCGPVWPMLGTSCQLEQGSHRTNRERGQGASRSSLQEGERRTCFFGRWQCPTGLCERVIFRHSHFHFVHHFLEIRWMLHSHQYQEGSQE